MQSTRAVEARHIKETIAGTKLRLAKHVENEDTWQRYVEVETHRHQDTGVLRALAKVQAKGKSKGKKRTPKTCLCCGKEGRKKADWKFKTATCSNCGKVGHLRAVCRNTNTHTRLIRMQMKPVQKSLSKQFGAWLFVEDGDCDCIEKHDVRSEHRDESKFRNVIKNIETDQKFKKRYHEHGDGSKFGKVVTRIEMDEQDRNRRQKSTH